MNSDPIISVQPSRFGKGLFALTDIAAGVVLCAVTGTYLSFKQTLSLQERESHTLQVDNDLYILCDPPFLYSNHSCNPNCALTHDLQLITLKNINQGDELVWDYSTSMLERHWTMPCACGAQNCRRLIEDFDLLPESAQENYLEKNMVLPFIVLQLLKQKAHARRA